MAATNFALAEGDGQLPPVPDAWWLTLIGSIVALVFAFIFYKSVMKQDEGTDVMREIAQSVREGAMAYLRQQYKVVTIVFIVLCVIFLIMAFGLHAQNTVVPFAFLTGGFFSGLCGFLGMKTATNASARTTSAAMDGLNAGLRVSFARAPSWAWSSSVLRYWTSRVGSSSSIICSRRFSRGSWEATLYPKSP